MLIEGREMAPSRAEEFLQLADNLLKNSKRAQRKRKEAKLSFLRTSHTNHFNPAKTFMIVELLKSLNH